MVFRNIFKMFGSLKWIIAITITASLVEANYSPPERLTGMNPCISKQTCHECIQTPHCAWCAAPVSFYTKIYLY